MRCGLLTLALLIACRDSTPSPPPPPAPPHDGVTLLQPGAPPLAMLRYHVTKGTRTSSELMYDVDVKSDGQSGPMPTLVVELDTVIQDVRDGAAELRITVVDASVRERPGSQLPSDLVRTQASALRGVVIAQTLAADGAISGSHVEAAGASAKASTELDNLLRSLERMAMRLPAEPVGIGALWRERRTLPDGGIRAVSEITYRLAGLGGSGFSYTGTGRAVGPPHTIEQDGMKVEVADTRGNAEVHGSIDLSRYAIDATAISTFATTMTVVSPDAGPGAARSTVEIAMAVRMTAGAPAAGAAAGAAPAAGDAPRAEPGDAGPQSPGGAGSAAAPAPAQGAHSAP
ncbi:MAG: hypothetical protein E6J90_29690 [Deltaproteobacteria bacterium]|nr:MAG: hypothetical protein E6J91_52390 [Deltaproteobacteria bacterium]TMQ12905.1 MAG: hypothetical protein E6J90_29690 [Deltaproteobacteria bacterium]